MDYRPLSKAMMSKYSSNVGIKVLSDVSYEDAEEIIRNIDSEKYLMKLVDEVKKSRLTRGLRHIRSLINKKMHALVH